MCQMARKIFPDQRCKTHIHIVTNSYKFQVRDLCVLFKVRKLEIWRNKLDVKVPVCVKEYNSLV